MQDLSSIPRAAQWAGGIVLLGIAVGAGGTGLVLNVRHGLDAGLAPAITYGLADLAKITIPIIAGWIGWSRHLKATAALCVAVSVWCAVNAWLDYNGRQAIDAAHATASAEGASSDLARLRTELAAIIETGSPDALRAAAKLQADKADGERKNGGCLKLCLAAQEKAAALTERAAQAERKSKLEADLVAARTAAGTAKAAVAVRSTGLIDAVIFIALVELLVWLSPLGMALIKAARASRPGPVAERVEEAKEEAPATVAVAASRPKSGTRDYYLDRLRREHPALAAQVHRGELTVNAASVAAELRQGRKTKRQLVEATPEGVAAHLATIARKAKKKEAAV